MKNKLNIGWSDFALKQNEKRTCSYYTGSKQKLIDLVKKHWANRVPGTGREDCKKVVVVKIKENNLSDFHCQWAYIKDVTNIKGRVVCRQANEDPYIELRGKGTPLGVAHVRVVLYSADTLLENDGERSGNYDWEIVAILAGPWEDEPMSPLTMARNYLELTGGTKAEYTAQQFAWSIFFWSQCIKVDQKPAKKKKRK